MKKYNNLFTTIFCISFSVWLFAITNDDAISMDSSHSSNKLDKEFSGIAKVSDGDTIRIDEKKIRLLYLDAPETKQTCFDGEYKEYSCGEVSKAFLINLAAEKEVKCFYEKFDRYGRYLAECFIEQTSINQELVKNGMAVTYFFGHVDSEIARLEGEAKEKKIGIWQGAFELPKDYRKSHPHNFNKKKSAEQYIQSN